MQKPEFLVGPLQKHVDVEPDDALKLIGLRAHLQADRHIISSGLQLAILAMVHDFFPQLNG